jgi:hypothetical protein
MKLTKRLTRISIVQNVVLLVTCLTFFVFAVVQRMEAEQKRIMAIQCEKMAIMERNRADNLAVLIETAQEEAEIAVKRAEIAMQIAEQARKRANEAAQKPD